jgi:two-component system sensor histidine kinase BaeS
VDVIGSLFDRFRRGPTRSEGSRRGLGIGLSVVRGLVDAMSGQVSADRSPLGGLAVSVRLRPAPLDPDR